MADQAVMERGAASRELLDTLNDLRARELAVVTQYMRHHYIITTPEGMALADQFKEIALTEMKHAERLAERIDFLGGDPTTKPEAIATGQRTLEEMAQVDLASEEDAVRRYRTGIERAQADGDVTTRRMLEDILADEEEHVNSFRQMLGR